MKMGHTGQPMLKTGTAEMQWASSITNNPTRFAIDRSDLLDCFLFSLYKN